MRKKADWRIALSLEAAVNFALTALLAPLSVSAGQAYLIVMWIVLPCVGAATAYIAVRKGLNNYVSWPVPAVCSVAAHWIIIGFPPSSAGMALLNAGLCLVACAAAQVKNERDDKK